jgi:hypothetical protein
VVLVLHATVISWLVARPAGARSKPAAIAAADLDADPLCPGCADLVVGDRGLAQLNVYLGHGDGTFATPVTLPVDAALLSVALGDCDGDGDLDVFVSTVSPTHALTVFVNQAQQGSPGTFVATPPSPLALADGGPTAILAQNGSGQPLDVDGDGALDLAVIQRGKHLAVLMGDGSCGFGAPVASLASGKLTGLAAADLDGAGGVDLIVTDRHSFNVVMLFNDGTGHFPAMHLANVPRPSGLVATDINGDGLPDVMAIDDRNFGAPLNFGVYRLTNFGNRTFSAPSIFGAGGRQPVAAVAGTFTADASVDLAVVSKSDDVVALVPGEGNTNFDPPAPSSAGGTKPVAVAAADFDGDGLEDVAVAGSGGVAICLSNGAAFSCTPLASLVPPPGP